MSKRLLTCSLAVVGMAASLSMALAEGAPQQVQSGTYKVEPGHTQVVFSLLHFGFTNYSGLFSGASGTLALDSVHPAASKLTISLPVSSVQTTSDRLTDELKGADWLDAAKYPTATFVSTQVVPDGKGGASITGNFTLHGITRPLTLQARYVGSGVNPMDKAYTVGFQATGVIKRSEFGVKTYVPMVGDEVTLAIAGAFEKQN
ncbi:YceI family protein [Acetobacter tropicalis]|uniref:Polyisoprenoid-binding protein n=2 Tax=Acetobacter TaxID=434 RepID=A0A149TVW8_9PROT|nr:MULTISPECIES: YceI family protein [Acetobacter]KXV57237.1 polyisoprenoid-binding protein [Acetobacter senegalensis]MCC6105228.1 YceI family protein [Acetobacter sp.]MCG4254649.1 YceI family protein [Acetobacter senegalensis]MCG4261672.1 YceI family protein [Acetobacter senegalensis]MCG4273790.1 YceI family protein [Acetobacter senegalensis]